MIYLVARRGVKLKKPRNLKEQRTRNDLEKIIDKDKLNEVIEEKAVSSLKKAALEILAKHSHEHY